MLAVPNPSSPSKEALPSDQAISSLPAVPMDGCQKGSDLLSSSCLIQKGAILRRCGQCPQLLPSGKINSRAEEGWSELPMDLLGSILEHLQTPDRARFRSVCTAWNSAPPPLYAPLETPCLLFSPSVSDPISGIDDEQKSDKKYRASQLIGHQQMALYSISDDRAYKLRGHRSDVIADCCVIISYSPGGWLMYVDRVCELHCVHLPTGERIHPPSITTTPFVRRVKMDSQGHIIGYYIYDGPTGYVLCNQMIRWYYYRGIIFFPGSSPDYLPTTDYNSCSTPGTGHDYVIVVAHDVCGKIIFARKGDTAWTLLNLGPTMFELRDFFLHRGSLYMVQKYGMNIFRIKVNSDLSFGPASILPSNVSFLTSDITQQASTAYLVDIDGHVCLIWRTTDIMSPDLEGESEVDNDVEQNYEADDTEEGDERDDADDDEDNDDDDDDDFYIPSSFKTMRFQVFLFDDSQTTWVEKDSIGDYAIFVGSNYSLALSTLDLPHLTRDCIYFTDDECESYGSTSWDLGVYNLRDRSVSPYYDGFISMGLPQPIWVMLSSFYDS